MFPTHNASSHILHDSFNNGSSTLNATADVVCHPLLLANSSSWYFIDKNLLPNETIMYGICPDTIFTPISVSLVYAILILLTIPSIILLSFQYKSKYIQARSPIYMWCALIATFIGHSSQALRFFIGRRIYPCGLYTLSLFILFPFLFLPSFFRFFRAWLLFEINSIKTKVLGEKRRGVGNYLQDQRGTVNSPIAIEWKERELNDSKDNGCDNVIVNSDQMTTPIDSFMVVDFDLTKTNEEPKSAISTSSRFSSNSKTMDNNLEATDKSYSSSFSIDFKVKFRKEIKRLYILQLLSSHKFITIFYIVSAVIHFILWLIFASIEEIVFQTQNNNETVQKKIFIYDGGMFDFTRGCVMTTNFLILIGIQGFFYIFLELFAAVLLIIRSDGDTWFIRKEAITTAVVELILIILFVIGGQLDIVNTLTDFIVPNGVTFLTGTNFQILFTVFIPLCYSLYYDRTERLKRKNSSKTKLERLLKEPKTFTIFLDYARKSFCPETVLCWEDVMKFKKVKKSKRREYGKYILEKYLKVDESPLEINISKNVARYEEMNSLFNDESKEIQKEVFDYLELHCLRDMTDLYSRLLNENEEINEMVRKWTEEEDKNKEETLSTVFEEP
ncbi:hypothetical protein ABK040_016376 [Willaertia magna]